MSQTSNSLFFGVSETPPLQNVGFEVIVRSHTDFTTTLAVINEYIELMIGPELLAPGNGSITMDEDSPFWDTNLSNGDPALDLLDNDNLWQAYEDGALRFEWFGTTVRQGLASDDETRTISVSGPGAAHVLKWGAVLPPGFPSSTGFFWEFTTDTAMGAYLKILAANQALGVATWVDPMFTAAKDSGGVDWADLGHAAYPVPFKPELGTDLLALLDIVTGQDLDKQVVMRAEWIMWPGFQLDVRPTIGEHRESDVIFYETNTIREKERTRVRDAISNYVVVRDVYGATSLASDSSSIAKWNKRITLEQHGNITDSARRSQVADVILQQRKDETSSWKIKLEYGVEGRRPFQDFTLGDWVGVANYTRSTGVTTIDAYRVLAIVIQVNSDGFVSMELTLESKLESRQRELKKKLTMIENTIGNNGLGDNPDVRLPSPMPSSAVPLEWDPATGLWGVGSYPTGGGGGGGGGSSTVYVQPDDPADTFTVVEGDMWYPFPV